MKKIVLATMLSATMMFTALTPAFAESKAPVATESTESTDKQITFNDAVDAALKDAGLAKDKVTFSEKMQTVEDGKQVYEIKFIVPGETKYEYVIDEKTGAVVSKESEAWEADDDAEYAALLKESQNLFDFEAAEAQIVVMPASSKLIEECAQDRQEEVAYYKDGMEYEDGKIVYELCAMIPKEVKFEYKFDMKTGEVISSEKEEWEAEDNVEYREILESHGFTAE